LLSGLDIDYEIRIMPNIAEDYPADLPADEVAEYISREKAAAYLPTLADDELVITADTVVILDGDIIGKPHSLEEAKQMLHRLSGKKHRVMTGVCLSSKQRQHAFSAKTDVQFSPLTEEEIDYYVEKYQPLDKAGAYGVQEWIGYVGVTALEGSYFNVMGFPVQRVYQELKKFG
jgi:septum formation protein